ncbi:hypothetical protein EVG20_g4709, partial [Dentipellis fragilis]
MHRTRPLTRALLRVPRRRVLPVRPYSQDSVTDVKPVDDAPPAPPTAEAWLFADSLFPIRLGLSGVSTSSASLSARLTFPSVRHYLGLFRQDASARRVSSRSLAKSTRTDS